MAPRREASCEAPGKKRVFGNRFDGQLYIRTAAPPQHGAHASVRAVGAR
jgi:hypothetical protein